MVKYMNNSTKAIVLVHGKSELAIVQFIKSNLRLPIEIVSKDRGKHSIQINSLKNILTDFRFKTPTQFQNNFSNVEMKKNKLINCRIFMIMDLDDATFNQQQAYKDKSMFNSYWFKDYVEPIYNNRCLEDVLKIMQYPYAPNKSKKGNYVTIFPNVDARGADKQQIENFSLACKLCKDTNMEVLLEYCIQHVVKY